MNTLRNIFSSKEPNTTDVNKLIKYYKKQPVEKNIKRLQELGNKIRNETTKYLHLYTMPKICSKEDEAKIKALSSVLNLHLRKPCDANEIIISIAEIHTKDLPEIMKIFKNPRNIVHVPFNNELNDPAILREFDELFGSRKRSKKISKRKSKRKY